VVGWRHTLRLPRDHYVRLDGNDYSVHPATIGRRIEVVADLARVRAFCAGRMVANHQRIWAKHQTLTDPEHLAAARAMRRDRLELVHRHITDPPNPAEPQVEQRRLADYDAALGIDGGVA
jgi:hypothetical protein